MNTRFFLAGMVLAVVIACENISLSSGDDSEINKGGKQYHTDIAVSFMLYHDGLSRISTITSRESVPPYSVFVMIWRDGHVLFREQRDDEAKKEEIYNFQRGIVDKNSVDALQKKLVSLFRLKNQRVYIADFGPSASYKVLAINDGELSVTIDTWEQWRNADIYPTRLRLHESNAVDNRAMYLGEFYEKWQIAKKEIYAFTDKIDRNTLIPVDVVVDDEAFKKPPVIRVYDKEGTLLFEQKIRRDL